MRVWLRVVLFVAILIPSGYFAWSNRDMQHLGWLEDDAIYVTSGRSLAQNNGYRIPFLPAEPWQTKYPPALPALIAAGWLVNPEFPGDLGWMALLAWSSVPVLLALVWILYRRWGFSEPAAFALAAFIGVNGYVAVFGATLMTELPFTAALIAVVLLHGRANSRSEWLVCGAACGIAFLFRTVALPLIVVLPLIARRRRALWLAAGMAPFVAGWMIWAATHRAPERDLLTIYFTDYLGDLLWNANASNYHLFLWKNVDGFLSGLGALLLPGLSDAQPGKTLQQCFAVFGIAGAVRLARSRPVVLPFAAAAVVIAAMLVAWCYPPTERLVFPVFPIVLAGAAHELQRLIGAVRVAWGRQRAVAAVFATVLAGMGVLVTLQHVELWRDSMTVFVSLEHKKWQDNRVCFERIRTEIPPDAAIVTENAPVLWLFTGRKTIGMHFPVAWWYEDRRDRIVEYFTRPERIARQYGARYAFLNRITRDGSESERVEMRRGLMANPELEPLFSCGEARLWRVR